MTTVSLDERLLRVALLTALALGCAAPAATSAAEPGSTSDDLAALKVENERLRSLIPSQSHAMMDVAYHFTNLWFAGQHENWPLAQFYFNEAHNHIQWAIRIVPVRRTSGGELRLEEIFTTFDDTLLAEVKKQIAAKNRAQFSIAYRKALEGCNACHIASEKPFLHVRVPDRPQVHIVDFDPQGNRAPQR
jgi:hypothetical protein